MKHRPEGLIIPSDGLFAWIDIQRLCYQWGEDYFNAADAQEDKEKGPEGLIIPSDDLFAWIDIQNQCPVVCDGLDRRSDDIVNLFCVASWLSQPLRTLFWNAVGRNARLPEKKPS